MTHVYRFRLLRQSSWAQLRVPTMESLRSYAKCGFQTPDKHPLCVRNQGTMLTDDMQGLIKRCPLNNSYLCEFMCI